MSRVGCGASSSRHVASIEAGEVRILAIQNSLLEGFGSYFDCLVAAGATVEVIHPYRGDAFPSLGRWKAILIGGTPISVYEARQHPFLSLESRFVAAAVARDVPCLGICAGAQLLAQILGAHVRRNPAGEIGGYQVRLTEAGARDPLFCRFPERFPVFQWHGDTFDVPEGGVLLALGELCHNQAFRSGKVVGLQFHLEVSPAEAAVWAQAYTGELAESGKTAHRVAAECAATALEEQRLAALLMHNFLETLRAGEAKRAVSGRCGIPPA